MSKSSDTQSNLDISLHALVVVSISDHFTRSRVRAGAERVFGMLLGVQQGRKVEIFSSFECAVGENGLLNTQYLEDRKNAGMYPSFLNQYPLLCMWLPPSLLEIALMAC